MPINAAKQLFEAEIITKGLFNIIYLVKVRTRAHTQIPTDTYTYIISCFNPTNWNNYLKMIMFSYKVGYRTHINTCTI